MTDQPYNSLPVGVSPAVLEIIQQEGKEWERRAERLEKDWEHEKRRADDAESRASKLAEAVVSLNAELAAREAENKALRAVPALPPPPRPARPSTPGRESRGVKTGVIMKPFWKWLAMLAYRQWSKGQPDRRIPDGVPGNRDPDNPCTAYAPRPRQMGDFRDCQTDGHYLCRECCHRAVETDAGTLTPLMHPRFGND